jgi:uncharacterized protein (TIGR02246 family)
VRLSTGAVILFAITVPLAGAQAQPANRTADQRAVEGVLARYKTAIESLDARGTEVLFAGDSQIYESGGSEGTYANYLAHHLGPELGHFRSFRFSNYRIAVRFEGPVALATETYRYRIEPTTGEAVERAGVATSVLRRVRGSWRIISMHNSSRRPPAP